MRTLIILLSCILLTHCESSITNADIDGPTTIIHFSLPTDSEVKLTIENSYNTIISTPVDMTLSAGVYEVEVDTDGWADGVYFYTVVVKGLDNNYYFESTKNLLLIRK